MSTIIDTHHSLTKTLSGFPVIPVPYHQESWLMADPDERQRQLRRYEQLYAEISAVLEKYPDLAQ